MRSASSNTGIHLDTQAKLIPTIEKFSDPNFFVFKLKTEGNEMTYFFMDELQLLNFVQSLKSLTIPSIPYESNKHA